MSTMLPGDAVLQPSVMCTARPQKGGYLFYHYRTDELHLVPPVGYYIYQLCDGLRSVDEIEHLFTRDSEPAPNCEERPVRSFLEKLVTRGILEIAGV
jgi:hypothetical protein